jgi:ABC-type phosphate transport system permease subunit
MEMKVQWNKNPKTPEGWPKRAAIAMLAGLGVFILSLPVSFLLFLDHYQKLYPRDPQNFLGALTSAIVVGLTLALLTIPTVIAILMLLRALRSKPTKSVTL